MIRFFRRGLSKLYFTSSISNPAAPLTSELDSTGTDLSESLAGISGFAMGNSVIQVDALSSSYTYTYPGKFSAGNSSLLFYDDKNTSTIRDLFPKNGTGYLVFCPYGRGTGKRCEVWRVFSLGAEDQWEIGNSPARFNVGFSVPVAPVQNAVLP